MYINIRSLWSLFALFSIALGMPSAFAGGTGPEVEQIVVNAGPVSGGAASSYRRFYKFNAEAGDQIEVHISSVEDNAVFAIYKPGATITQIEFGFEINGQPLDGAGETSDAKRWLGVIPEAGEYLVVVGSTRGGTSYQLVVGKNN